MARRSETIFATHNLLQELMRITTRGHCRSFKLNHHDMREIIANASRKLRGKGVVRKICNSEDLDGCKAALSKPSTTLLLNHFAYLLKANVGSPLAKALTANVQTVLANDAVPVTAHTAVSNVTLS